MPAGDIAVPDQKHLVVAIEHDAADAQRHAAGHPPVEMEDPPQLRFEALSQSAAAPSRKPRMDSYHV